MLHKIKKDWLLNKNMENIWCNLRLLNNDRIFWKVTKTVPHLTQPVFQFFACILLLQHDPSVSKYNTKLFFSFDHNIVLNIFYIEVEVVLNNPLSVIGRLTFYDLQHNAKKKTPWQTCAADGGIGDKLHRKWKKSSEKAVRGINLTPPNLIMANYICMRVLGGVRQGGLGWFYLCSLVRSCFSDG